MLCVPEHQVTLQRLTSLTAFCHRGPAPPASRLGFALGGRFLTSKAPACNHQLGAERSRDKRGAPHAAAQHKGAARSEEHTSELQSLMRISYAVFCLKKKNITHTT